MFPTVLLLVICLFGVPLTYAFDWSDPDFNLMLQEDILDNLEDYDLPEDEYIQRNHQRVVRAVEGNQPPPSSGDCVTKDGRRAGSGNNRYHRACCGEKDDLKMHGEALRKLRKECLVDIRKLRMSKLNGDEEGPLDMFNCERVKKNREDMICVMECVAKKKEMIDIEGNLLPDSVKSFVQNELATEDWQKRIIDSVIEKCLQQNTSASNITTNNADIAGTTGQRESLMNCNPASLKFSHCLWREMQLSCPKDMIKNTKICQRMRERLEKQESPNFPKKGRLGPKQRNSED